MNLMKFLKGLFKKKVSLNEKIDCVNEVYVTKHNDLELIKGVSTSPLSNKVKSVDKETAVDVVKDVVKEADVIKKAIKKRTKK